LVPSLGDTGDVDEVELVQAALAHVVLVHENDGPQSLQPTVAIVVGVDGRVELVMRRHARPGSPVRLALKDLELVREVQQSSQVTMPLLDAVLERFATASEHLADQDLAAIYELGGSR
jgi:hypothetical protein